MPKLQVSPPAAEVEQQLARICSHPLFASSPTLRRFLQFVVRKALSGSLNEIKEYTIAVECMGRGKTFDARDSSVVRTAALNLRNKLKAYYLEQGAEVPFQIVFRPGTYVPAFVIPERQRESGSKGASAYRIQLNPIARHDDVDAFEQELRRQISDITQHGSSPVAEFDGPNPSSTVRTLAGCPIRTTFDRVGGLIRVHVSLFARHDPSLLVWTRRMEWNEAHFDVEHAAREVARELKSDIYDLEMPTSSALRLAGPAGPLDHQQGLNLLAAMNVADCRRAQQLFLQRMNIRPYWAAAHSGFALAIAQGALLGDPDSIHQLPEAEAAAARSLALESSAGLSQVARGTTLAMMEWTVDAAARYLDYADRLQDPDQPEPICSSWSALLRDMPRMRYSQAIELLEAVVAVSPSHMLARFALGTALRLARRYSEALRVFSTSIQLDDRCGIAAVGMAQVYAALQDYTEALTNLRRAETSMGRTATLIGLEGYLAGSTGDHERASSLLFELTKLAKPDIPYFFERALIQVGQGEMASARSAMGQSIRRREPAAFLGRFDPLLTSLS